jgi:uncharacterized protein YfaS (alpha-2-macroglobulin family)
MTGFARTARPVLVVLLALFGLATAMMGADAGERRILLTPDSDYTGFDLRTVKGVDLKACEAACLGDTACRAFTFNQKAGWCFLKSDNGPLAGFTGATAGRVVEAVAFTPTVEQQRKAELDFTGSYFDEARTLATNLKNRYDPGTAGYMALRTSGGTAYAAGNFDQAASEFGKALVLASDSPVAWSDYAIASLRRNPENWSDRQQAMSDATAGAINAYLRADMVDDRARSLAVLGDSFAKREVWKPAWRAYRASLAVKEDADVRATYDRVLAERGFRILSHEVDADAAQPRICVVFSDDLPVSRADLADFVTVEGGSGLAIEPQRRQICVDGVQHGGRYKIRVRGGLPSADGETLARPVDLDVYVRDRAPWVGFAGNAYVLPAGQGASIPMVSVNAPKALATIYRISDRSLAGQVREGDALRQLDRYTARRIGESYGEEVWKGEIDITSRLNETVTTAIPIADAVNTLKPGAYVITAKPATDTQEWGSIATQWFVISDIGLTSLSGNDGIHVIARSLSSAEPIANARVRLVALNNDVLGEGITDANGYARFDPGLGRGTGGAAPQLVDAETAAGDYTFLDLGRSSFDLTDRGVDGRPAPGPLDVFLTPERGIYRPGETVYLTALVRNARADAVGDLPLTLVIERPDGVEFVRRTLSDGGAGGYSAAVLLDDDAMRGSWRAKLFSDPKGAAIADVALLVEDFEPERLAFDITTAATSIGAGAPVAIDLSARYLYGATAPDLSVDGDIDIRTVDTLAGFPGYKFGLATDDPQSRREPFETDATTDADGKATFEAALPELPSSTKPFEAKVIVRLTDTNGRAVERTLSLPVAATGPRLGVKPLFDGDVAEGGPARFEVILVGADGQRIAQPGVKWTLERIETDYQWYRADGNWRYEPITQERRVDGGTVDTKADSAVAISGQVSWGHYRLTVSTEGSSPTATSVEFNAGWYVAQSGTDTPDVLSVGLDKPAYRIGETVKLRLDPRFAGIALITVVDDRLISMKSVAVPAEGTTVELEVTDQWGPGAYVTASLYRPMDVEAKRMPARALGLAWAKVSPGDRQLNVAIEASDEMRPRGPMPIPVSIANLQPGEQAFVTVAAVDLGILNLTNFKPPAPDEWYFGQRKLGMEIRDVYGLLIDRMQGVPGAVRSGGDGGAVRLQAPPPTQKLVAFYSGIEQVGPDGKVSVSFNLPEFNGTVRVMVMAWTKTAVGHAVKDVIVRDPVVVSASIPRFMATGDTSRLLVEINNVAGPAGDYRLAVNPDAGVTMAAADLTKTLTLASGARTQFILPIAATGVGDHIVSVTLTTPDGQALPQELALGVRAPGLPVTRRNYVALASGGKLTVSADTLAEFVPGTTSVSLSVGGPSRLDVAGILAALDRYPYGCAEQLTSRALPLVYLDDVAVAVGLAGDAAVKERVQTAIAGVLAKQAASGAFGLWGPVDTGDLFLDAYVTDFLTRAADKGYDVPKVARDLALDNLSNSLAYADDFESGGQSIAYALYVLARTGRAAIGDLRYYGESKLSAFSTPLAKAQIGAALALYGDQRRANAAFAAALADLNGETDAIASARDDYGTVLRDQAAVLTLAAESRAETVDLKALAARIAASAEARRRTSTQENAWMLLAANALIKDAQRTSFAIDGTQTDGPLYRRFFGEQLATPIVVENRGGESLDAVVETRGVPLTPEPAGGEGFTIERAYYTPAGEERDIATIAQNDRVIVVLKVTASESRAGHVLVVDPIPAGFEIENPSISESGDTANYGWLDVVLDAEHTEARTDRFVAALKRTDSDPQEYSVAYSMRAVAPGKFAQPAATVEDMYYPELQAHSTSGTVEVVGQTR